MMETSTSFHRHSERMANAMTENGFASTDGINIITWLHSETPLKEQLSRIGGTMVSLIFHPLKKKLE